MILKSFNGAWIAAVAVCLCSIFIFFTGINKVHSHPHNALAMCQLADGKWVSCDDVIHDAISNKHVPKQTSAMPGTLKAPGKGKPVTPLKAKKLKVHSGMNKAVGQSSAIGGMTVPFNANCANGFSKAGDKKLPNGDLDWYVCSTPVIQCPSYVQSNGQKAHVKPKAIVQMIGANPDGGAQKFRVQYKCEYDFNPVPVP